MTWKIFLLFSRVPIPDDELSSDAPPLLPCLFPVLADWLDKPVLGQWGGCMGREMCAQRWMMQSTTASMEEAFGSWRKVLHHS